MKKMANKMMVAAAMNRRRMESENRKVPMYTDQNGNNRRMNPMQSYNPQNTGDMEYYGAANYPAEMRQQRGRDGRYMYAPEMPNAGYIEPTHVDGYAETAMTADTEHMIGFDRSYGRTPYTNRMTKEGYKGNVYAKGSIMMSPENDYDQYSGNGKPVDELAAVRWVKKMRNADGTSGAHFKFDTADQLRQQYCAECNPWEFYTALNMMYSDYAPVAIKLKVDTPEFYACMAKAFLCDADAGEGKLRKYMECIPR